MSTQDTANNAPDQGAASDSTRTRRLFGDSLDKRRPHFLARWRTWIPKVAVWVIGVTGLCGLVGGAWWALRAPQTPNAATSGEISTLLEIGATLETEIERTVRPAMQRTDMLAADTQLARLLTTNDVVGQTAWLNRAITTATEVDAIALFDAKGQIRSINTQYADGKPIAPQRIQSLLGTDFGKREIIQKCLRNGINAPVLEFQTHCDITPALFDSTGLSVAYSVPVLDSNGGAKIGVISVRTRFDRISALIKDRVVGGGAAKVYLVTDAGAYFSETINAFKEQPPVPVAELRGMVRSLAEGRMSKILTQRADKYLLVFPITRFETLDGGGINVLVMADERWIMDDVRKEQLLQAASVGLFGTLILIIAGLIHAGLTAGRMKETSGRASTANARLAAIVQSSVDAIIGETLDGAILSWNPAAERMFGFAASEVEGRKSELLEPPERLHEMVELRSKALSGMRVEHVETQRVRKNGQMIDVSVSLAVIKDEWGATVGIAKIARDITRQKRAEHEVRKAFDQLEIRVVERTSELSETVKALESQMAERLQAQTSLRASEERFRQLAENTKDVFWMASLSGDQILYVSPRYEEIWGRPCQGLYDNAHDWMEAIEPEDRPAVMTAWLTLPQSGEYEVEYRIRRPDGTIRWIRDRALPVRDTAGAICSIAGIAEDFTDRRRGEQQIIEAKNIAENANRAKSEFLANMSHEIRTPLNGISGMLELLRGTKLNEQQRRYSKLAADSATSLTSLICDILDLSKIEAGKLEIDTEDFDLHGVIEDAIDMLAQKAAKKQLELACRFAADAPRLVRGDPGRLRQIVVNLVNNAIKFTETGSVTLTVSCEEKSDQSAMIRLNVRDTGIGIPADRIERLFKSFSQVDSSTSRKYGGTGLGLSICKQLAELMGGKIGVESKEGQGSTFWVVVKLGLAPAGQSKPKARAINPANLRVLAVENNVDHRETLLQQISSWGMEAQSADHDGQAISLLMEAARQGKPFHVSIVAGGMSKQEWATFAAKVRQTPSLAHTALIGLTSIDDPLTLDGLRKIGFNARMTIPVRQSMMFDAISDAIANVNNFSLPEEVEAASAGQPDVPTRETASGAKRILLAEDNTINQILANEILTGAGHHCDTVTDGRQAIDAVFAGNYDVVLMDCQMPGTDGFEATRIIREREQQAQGDDKRHITIIALTANALKGDREHCIAAGMDAYCPKPFTGSQLLKVIDSSLASHKPAIVPEAAAVLPNSNLPTENPVANSNSACIDLDSLLERCMNNIEVAGLILDQFKIQTTDQLVQLEQSASNGDIDQIARVAHTMKGASGMAGAQECHRIAADLEQLARSRQMDQVSPCLAKLQEEFRSLLLELPMAQESLKSRPSQPVPQLPEVK